MDAAIFEVQAIARVLLGLLDGDADLTQMDLLLDAKSGQEGIIGSALKQQQWWSNRCKEAKQVH
eukprot:3022103-Amphidinium_carterae.1